MLFEEKSREFQGPKTYIETDFEYLDRSARKEAARIREFLNRWIAAFPEAEANEIISRITSGDKKGFDSAIFEIVLFAIIRCLGGEIEVHPELENGSNRHPDFLVRMPDGEEFYLEAVLASEHSESEKAAENRKNVVLESIEKLDSPNFFLGINASGNPDTPPKGKALRGELSQWLESLDPDGVMQEVEEYGSDHIPSMVWEHEGWKIEFKAIPKKPEARGLGQRVIGVLSGGGRWVNDWEPIREAIRFKGNRYGELGKPFVIAVNIDCFPLDRIDEMQALFGQEEFVFIRGGEPEMRRIPNGAWFGPEGPQYTRVSGAWIWGGGMNPWNIVSRKNTLYFHPRAQFPLSNALTVVNCAMAEEEKMEWREGKRVSEILGLSEEWPR